MELVSLEVISLTVVLLVVGVWVFAFVFVVVVLVVEFVDVADTDACICMFTLSEWFELEFVVDAVVAAAAAADVASLEVFSFCAWLIDVLTESMFCLALVSCTYLTR